MSETPRTDANLGKHLTRTGFPVVDPMFARQLERELCAAEMELEVLRTANAGLMEKVKRLETAGNDLVWWFCQIEPSQLSSTQSASLKQWRDLRGRRNP